MDVIRPNANYDDIASEFQYNDGGIVYDWSSTTLTYPKDMGKTWLENVNEASQQENTSLNIPNVDLQNLNTDQLLAFNIVMSTLFQYKEICISENAKNAFIPLRMIVSGTAGSGKSYLIKCLVKGIRTLFNTNKSVQVLCPTGNSANLISGVTLHSFLKIPTNKKGKEMKSPDGTIGETLQRNCDGVRVLLVDERSLIGATVLGWMEFMCKCGMMKGANSDKSWGGIPVVVFFGDDVQLPPVLDSPVHNSKSTTPAAMHGVLVWQEFKTAVHLEKTVRQGKEEQEFTELLSSLREYKATPKQAVWLQQFQWENLRKSHGQELLQDMSNKSLFVFPTHEEEWQHNKTKLLEANSHFPIAKLNALSQGPHSKTSESARAGGLINTLYICKKAKVMLSVNICVKYGLFKGAIGTVVDIVYSNDTQPPTSLPEAVMVEFPSYTGPPFVESNAKIVPLVPVSRQMDCRCFSCKRKQIPLRLGWATTIHKCQGMTIGAGEINRYIVINPGTKLFESRNPGALFVALSRAKSIGLCNRNIPDFAWHPSVLLNEDRVCHEVKTSTTTERSKEIIRISNIAKEAKQKFAHLQNDMSFVTSIQQLFSNEEVYEE